MSLQKSGLVPASASRDTAIMSSPPDLAADARAEELVQRLCRYIDARVADGPVTLKQLSAVAKLSPWHLQRLFKRVLGISPRDYADAQRLKKLRLGLRQGDGIADATFDAGLGSSSRLYEHAHKHLGMTPASYAKGGKGAAIRYGLAETRMGWILAATTDKGVCFVALGTASGVLEQQLRDEFPFAESMTRDDQALGKVLRHLGTLIAGDMPRETLPLDIRATAFQRRVWQILTDIPAGETRTYAEIAASLGQPQAQRAVGSACARNPVALLIPCHRAVRRDGGLGGYRWGLALKEKFLEQESAKAGTK